MHLTRWFSWTAKNSSWCGLVNRSPMTLSLHGSFIWWSRTTSSHCKELLRSASSKWTIQSCLKGPNKTLPSQQKQPHQTMTNGLSLKFFATEIWRWKARTKFAATTTTIKMWWTLTTCSTIKKLSSMKSLELMKTWNLSSKKARTVSAFKPMLMIELLSSTGQSSKSSRTGMDKINLKAIGWSTSCTYRFLGTNEVMWLNQATWCSTTMSLAWSLLTSTTRTESSIWTWTLVKLLMNSACKQNWDKVVSQWLLMSSRMRKTRPVNLFRVSVRETCLRLTLGSILRVELPVIDHTRPTPCSALLPLLCQGV